ncbi:MAG: family 16 glycoside hydrolase [Verrucomicrobiales bacterium]
MIHRTARSAALFLGATAAALSLTAARAQDAEQIFNGKNLDGWEGNLKLWSVQDGVLVGETADSGDKKIKGNTFLIWKGGDVVNFELTATARCVGNNSGIQYRSKIVDPDNWVVAGYQMDMHPNQPYVGMLYDEKGRGIACLRGQKVVLENRQKPKVTGELPVEEVDLSKWNDFKIVAKGNTVEHYVNGKLAAVIVDNDEKERELSGILALQVHAGPAMKVEFKSVALRKLPGDAPAPKAEAEKPDGEEEAGEYQGAARRREAQWIWAAENSPDNETVYFRKAFDFDGPKQAAILQVSCDNHYEIALNGKAVGKGDAWESPGSYDVRAQLVPGKNVIAVKARNDSGIAALAVALNIDAGKGRPAPSVVSDASWKWSRETADGWATAAFDDSKWSEPFVHGAMGRAPWNDVFSTALAQGGIQDVSEELNALPGFRIEKLYHVPKGQQGSWVSLTADPQGRLYASDQGGKICRITPPPVDADEDAEPVVEPLDLEIGHAHGLLWAFDSLYVSVNGGRGSGLYRVTDKNGDGELDDVALLRKMDGGGEHGPHAVVLSPDGKSLYVAGGNHTKIPAPEKSRVPRVWDEDQVLTRMPDARATPTA